MPPVTFIPPLPPPPPIAAGCRDIVAPGLDVAGEAAITCTAIAAAAGNRHYIEIACRAGAEGDVDASVTLNPPLPPPPPSDWKVAPVPLSVVGMSPVTDSDLPSPPHRRAADADYDRPLAPFDRDAAVTLNPPLPPPPPAGWTKTPWLSRRWSGYCHQQAVTSCCRRRAKAADSIPVPLAGAEAGADSPVTLNPPLRRRRQATGCWRHTLSSPLNQISLWMVANTACRRRRRRQTQASADAELPLAPFDAQFRP
jgi:hypothetical protein